MVSYALAHFPPINYYLRSSFPSIIFPAIYFSHSLFFLRIVFFLPQLFPTVQFFLTLYFSVVLFFLYYFQISVCYCNIAFYPSPAESTVIVSTTAKTDNIPVSARTKSWYKNPMIIMGISIGGLFVLCIILVIIVVILTRK